MLSPIIGPICQGEATITDEALLEPSPQLSIVIPAFNEERRLPATLERLQMYLSEQGYAREIIVVSNGSTDQTDAVVREAMRTMAELRLISLTERGKGLAVREGVLQSTGHVVFLCDADLSMPPEELATFLELTEQADVVAGSREAPGAQRYNEPWHRHLMGRVFNWIVRLLAVRGISDTQCGFKAFRREAADELFSRQTVTGLGFDVEILYLAEKYGYRIIELGIDWYFDTDTRVRPGIDTITMVGELLMVRIRDLRHQYRRTVSPARTGEDRA